MIVYIAGPMTGLPEFNYPAFNAAEEALTASGYTVLNPARNEAPPTSDVDAWAWYMRLALRMVTQADGICLLNGWEASRGARLEQTVATELGMKVGTLYAWMTAEVTA